MIKVGHMGFSSSQTSEKGNHFHPEESISEQPLGLPPGFESRNYSIQQAKLDSEDTSKDSGAELHETTPKNLLNNGIQTSNNSLVDPFGLPPGFESRSPSIQQPKLDSEDMSKDSGSELHETMPKNLLNNVIQTSNNSLVEPLGLPPGFDSRNPSIQQPKLDSEDMSKDSGAELHETAPKNLLNNVIQTSNNSLVDPLGSPGFDSRSPSIQQPKLDSEDMSKDSGAELHETPPKNLLNNVIQTSNNSLVDPLGLSPGFDSRSPSIQQPKHNSEDMSKNSGTELHETTPKNLLKNSGRRRGGETSNKVKKSHMLSSLRSSDRVLRSKSQEKSKATELSNNLVNVGSGKQLHSKSQEKSKATELSNNLVGVGSGKQLHSKSQEKSKATELSNNLVGVGSGKQLHSKSQEKSKATELSNNLVDVGSGKQLQSKSQEKSKATELSNNLGDVGSGKKLRSKSVENTRATDSSNNLVDVISSKQQKRRKRKKGEKQEISDEYSKITRQLRYFLNRINYERSLIDAYSTEGWKGLSLEKLKPEKELQRATSEILRRKSKIRDLFQQIDSLCAEGRHSESLFDSEGEIDSEDIFCAKCGSKDLSLDNDIILCDGACDRGFHQYCLQPPLLKEDIPPDDEGWLCPGCDCKVDCIELVNESQGTSFSLDESWEKIFLEAALAAGGQNQDPNFGLPSDDSDDNDYNPDISDNDEKDQVDESSSDESDFTSASEEELEVVPSNVDPYSGLPSDDSEDDDYDPDGVNHDNVAKSESSSVDFTSDSEDLDAMLVQDDDATSNSASRNSKSKKPKFDGKKSLNDELLSVMETASGEDAIVSEKRHIQRLNYKRLYDETYGNVPSSSSDDEDWNDATAPRKRKKRNAEVASATPNGNTSLPRSVSVSNGLKQIPDEMEHTPRRRSRQKSNHKGTDKSSAELPGGASTHGSSVKEVISKKSKMPRTPGSSTPKMSPTPGSSGKKAGSSTSRRLGEAVTQGLYESFKQNQYPDRSMKESLANELGITVRQVTKWFENARWCFNHSKTVPGSTTEEPK